MNDSICQKLIIILDDSKEKTLTQFVQQTGFTRSTTQNHLKHLLDANLISKETLQVERLTRGRPTIIYRKKALEPKKP